VRTSKNDGAKVHERKKKQSKTAENHLHIRGVEEHGLAMKIMAD